MKQNILTLLLSTNIPTVAIFDLIFSGIELYMYFIVMSSLLKSKLSFIKYILFLLILVITTFLILLKVPFSYYIFINLSLAIILSTVIFKIPPFNASCLVFAFYATAFLFRCIWSIVYMALFNCLLKTLEQILLYKIILIVSISTSFYIFYQIGKKHFFKIRNFTSSKKHILLFISILLSLTIIVLHFSTAYLYFDRVPTVLNILNFALLLTYISINIYSFKKLEATTILLENEKLCSKNLSTLYDNVRGFKHDFNNIVQSIGGYISSNNINGLKVYYNDLLDDCQVNNNLAELNPEVINNPVIYSLLTDKYYKAVKLDVKIDFTILTTDLSHLNIKAYELSRILGILLDNAIEASSKTNNKLIHVTFKKDKNINKYLIIIENTYADKNINIGKIFEKGYSSKECKDKANHGLGLWEVNNYIQKRNNLNLITYKNDEYFIQQFEIYNN